MADIQERVKGLEVLVDHERADRQAGEARMEKRVDGLEQYVERRMGDLERAQEGWQEKADAKFASYDKKALSWGAYCLGLMTFGLLTWPGIDKIKDKLWERLL